MNKKDMRITLTGCLAGMGEGDEANITFHWDDIPSPSPSILNRNGTPSESITVKSGLAIGEVGDGTD